LENNFHILVIFTLYILDDQKRKVKRRQKRCKSVDVKRDEFGNIIFPIELGVLTIDALGNIVDKKFS